MKAIRLAAALALVLVACGGPTGGSGGGEESTTSSAPTTSSTTPGATTASGDGLPESVLSAIRSDAADRSGVSLDRVEVRSVTEETFRDTSLGCPEEGKMYAQVLTPGYQVLVQAGDEQLDYRVNADDNSFRICE